MCCFIFLASGMGTYSTLLAKEAREKWEKCFNDAYIQPTLRVRRDQRIYTLYSECLFSLTSSNWTHHYMKQHSFF